MTQLRDLCNQYGRDRSLARRNLTRVGVKLHLAPEYVGGQNVLWVHERDLPTAIAYLTRSNVTTVAPVAPEPTPGGFSYEPTLV